jgi:hypothetical protein
MHFLSVIGDRITQGTDARLCDPRAAALLLAPRLAEALRLRQSGGAWSSPGWRSGHTARTSSPPSRSRSSALGDFSVCSYLMFSAGLELDPSCS